VSALATVLDPLVHHRLIENIDEVASTAGVPKFMLHQSAVKYCPSQTLDWVRNFRKYRLNGQVGLAIVGPQEVAIETQMMAMAAAFVRNFIDARVIPVADMLGDHDVPNPSVLLVPNFYVSTDGKPFASWQLQQLHSLLLKRFVEQRGTVLYVSSMEKMEAHYGEGIAAHVKQNYRLLEI
jgi:hypothetical protein